MFRVPSFVLASVVLLLASTPCRAQIQFKGTVTFEWIVETSLLKPLGTTKIPVPKDTKIELVRVKLALPDVSEAITKVTDDKGSFAFPVFKPNANDKFLIRVYLSTLTSNPAKKEKETYRIHGQGYNLVLGLVSFEFFVETNHFGASRAKAGVSMINCHFGNLKDKDGVNPNGYELNEMKVNTNIAPLGAAVDEVYAASVAAVVVVLDLNYLDIEGSNKIPWWNELPKPGVGLALFSPQRINWRTTDAITIPYGALVDVLSIQIKGRSLSADTASHEFGHFLHYHTTQWTLPDFIDEVLKLGHWFSQESGRKVAYAEGFAEFYSAVWMRQYANKLVRPDWPFQKDAFPWDPWIDPEAHAILPPEFVLGTTQFWKGDGPVADVFLLKTKVDGTDNSGEIVEGAVAQAFFAMIDNPAKAPDVPGAIEPVWKVLREGASKNKDKKTTYNPIKQMHTDNPATGFYDMFMQVNSGGGSVGVRQKFRNSCNIRGIVYSRMKLSAFIDAAGTKVKITPNIEWANPKTKFELAPMVKKDLFTDNDLVGVISNAGLYIYDKGDGKAGTEKPRDFRDTTTIALPGTDLANMAVWKLFDNSLTDKNQYVGGELKAADGTVGKSLYYVIRGAVIKDQVGSKADTFSQDELPGPILGDVVNGKPIDKSGLLSAEWWNKINIILQIKVDRDRVILKNPKP